MNYDHVPRPLVDGDCYGYGFPPIRLKADRYRPGHGSDTNGGYPERIYPVPAPEAGLHERIRQLEDRLARLNHTNKRLRDTLVECQQWLQQYGCPWDPFRGY